MSNGRRVASRAVGDPMEDPAPYAPALIAVLPVVTWSTDARGLVERTAGHGAATPVVPDDATSLADAWRASVHPDDARATVTQWEASLRSGTVFETTHRLRSDVADFRWHRSHAVPELDGGEIIAWHGVSVDVHDREHDEIRLRRAEDDMRNVLDRLAEGFVLGDDERNVLWWNRAALDMHEFADMSECRETLPELHEVFEISTIDGRLVPHDEWPMERLLRGEAFSSEELRLRRLDRDWARWFLYGGAQLLDPRGRPLIFLTMIDVTERREALRQLRRTNLALERSNTDLKQFAYAASHDLQSPLRSISSYAALLERLDERELDATAQRCVRTINAATERLRSLVNDLLALSRVDSRAHPPGPVALDDVLGKVALMLDPAIREVQAMVRWDALPVVTGDAAQLSQVMQNLLDNALKYRSGAAPAITVSSRREENGWTIITEDNGVGVDREHRRVIFEIFQRLHGDEIAGSGIGLAICRRIVHRHGGSIWAEARPDGGSRFCFFLPDELPLSARA